MAKRSLSVPAEVRAAVLERDDHCCLRCGRNVEQVAHSVHHRYARKMGGTTDPRINDVRNLVLLCGTGTTGCHGWVESHRRQAGADGWILLHITDVRRELLNVYAQRIRLLPDGSKVLR